MRVETTKHRASNRELVGRVVARDDLQEPAALRPVTGASVSELNRFGNFGSVLDGCVPSGMHLPEVRESPPGSSLSGCAARTPFRSLSRSTISADL